jgi:hypothetical protein
MDPVFIPLEHLRQEALNSCFVSAQNIGSDCFLCLFLYMSAFVVANEYRPWNRQALQRLPLHGPRRWTVWIKIHLLCDGSSTERRRQALMRCKGDHSTFCQEVLFFRFRRLYSVLLPPTVPMPTVASPYTSSKCLCNASHLLTFSNKELYHCSLF